MGSDALDPVSPQARLAILDALPELVAVLDPEARVRWINASGLGKLGYTLEELVGRSVFDLIHPDDLGYMISSWERREANPGEAGLIVQGRCRRSDGTWFPGDIIGLSLLDEPDIGTMLVTVRDLTNQVALADSPGRLRSMVDRTTDILLLLSAEGRFLYANRRLTALLGHDSDRVTGTSWTAILDVADAEAATAWFDRLVADGDAATSRIDVRLVGTGGRSLTAELHGTNQLSDPLIGGVIVSARDIAQILAMRHELEDRNEMLVHVANHDSLTGIRTRGAFVDAVADAIARGRRGPAGLDDDVIVLFCDLDGFKAINDTHGHAVGDRVLQVIAERLRTESRDADVVARFGGDEFTILLATSESPATVNAIIARLARALEVPMDIDGITTRVGISIGVSRSPAVTAEVDALLRAADAAMYERKRRRSGAT